MKIKMKNKSMYRYIILSGLLFILTPLVNAQVFIGEATLEKAPQSGYYKIIIKPEISGLLNEYSSDIRIYDQSNKEVPYLLKKENLQQHSDTFYTFQNTEKFINPKVNSGIIIKKPSSYPISYIVLQIKNSTATKKVNISGSDDQKQWYIIKDDELYLGNNLNTVSGVSEVIINFPPSDYQYVKLTLSDSSSNPIQINEAGYYKDIIQQGKFIEVPNTFFTQTNNDSTKRSRIEIKFNQNFNLDRINYIISKPAYYYREATIYTSPNDTGAYEIYSTIILNSKNLSSIPLSKLNCKRIRIDIENKNDLPLTFESISCYELKKYLIAYLDSNQVYTIKYLNKDIVPASYDLVHHKEEIPASLSEINIINEKLTFPDSTLAENKPFFTNPYFIWLSIAALIALLSYMAFKLLKDMKNKES